jgi:hypothetical protein
MSRQLLRVTYYADAIREGSLDTNLTDAYPVDILIAA